MYASFTSTFLQFSLEFMRSFNSVESSYRYIEEIVILYIAGDREKLRHR